MKMTTRALDTLSDANAAEKIRHQREVINELTNRAERAERCCRDQAMLIARLHRQLREAETSPKRDGA